MSKSTMADRAMTTGQRQVYDPARDEIRPGSSHAQFEANGWEVEQGEAKHDSVSGDEE